MWTIEAAIAALVMAALSAWYLNRRIRAPLADLIERAEAVRQGNLDSRQPVSGGDEFGVVVAHFNAMTHELGVRRREASESQARLEEAIEGRTRELEQANRILRAVDAQRQEFFADISHELRTPATALRGEAEVALRARDLTGSDYRESLKRMVSMSVQMGQALDDLLTLARAQGDQLHVYLVPIDPLPPLGEVVRSMEGLAANAGVALQLRESPNVRPYSAKGWRVMADDMRLRQMLMVLLDNAVCYSRPGQTVALSAEIGESGCTYTVRDTGIGILPADIGKVFDRFYRSPGARKHRADGVGLGLAIAQMIAHLHGGEIALSSDGENGTVASVTLRTLV